MEEETGRTDEAPFPTLLSFGKKKNEKTLLVAVEYMTSRKSAVLSRQSDFL